MHKIIIRNKLKSLTVGIPLNISYLMLYVNAIFQNNNTEKSIALMCISDNAHECSGISYNTHLLVLNIDELILMIA